MQQHKPREPFSGLILYPPSANGQRIVAVEGWCEAGKTLVSSAVGDYRVTDPKEECGDRKHR